MKNELEMNENYGHDYDYDDEGKWIIGELQGKKHETFINMLNHFHGKSILIFISLVKRFGHEVTIWWIEWLMKPIGTRKAQW